MRCAALLLLCSLVTACGDRADSPKAPAFDALGRLDFNRRAAEHFLPLFWRADADDDQALDPDELVVVLGFGDQTPGAWVKNGAFTPRFTAAYDQLRREPELVGLPPAEQKRRAALLAELGQGRPTLIESDFRKSSAEDRAIVENVLAAARVIEEVYAEQLGVAGFAAELKDSESRMVFYRNQGPFCEQPKTEKDPNCNALASKPKKIFGLYPAAIQSGTDTAFCQQLEKRPDADVLLHQFYVVRTGAKDDLVAVPYAEAYRDRLTAISARLRAAAAAIQDPGEAAFKAYLEAAAGGFDTGNWQPADEAWSRMTVNNSKWYLRIGPDEVYFEPCSRKAGFHVSFARINPDSLVWQQKLKPLQADMEAALAALAGPPYQARKVSFQLPDFIDMVLNAGDSRSAVGATIGQSLPNWGPVANEGRNRTVAMVNLYQDPDSVEAFKSAVASLYCPATFAPMSFDPGLEVVTTVLHEAAHNLGPSHEYRSGGRTASQIFGGALASTLEELKAQTSALYFSEWLSERGILTQSDAENLHRRDVAWGFGHVATGMYDANGKPKAYSQLASIQLGWLLKAGALTWMPKTPAASGADRGCLALDLEAWTPAVNGLSRTVLQIKGRGDRAGAEALIREYVDDTGEWSKLRAVIAERWLRQPKASFVYAVQL